MTPTQAQFARSALWRLAWVLGLLVLARFLLWSMSWYSVRAALAFGVAFYGLQRLRHSRHTRRLRAIALNTGQGSS
jgi:hypothetical protein